jgi:hypothetical protein
MTNPHTNKRQGCLSAILSMISPSKAVTRVYGSSHQAPGAPDAPLEPARPELTSTEILPYKLQFGILTPTENAFYKTLKEITQNHIEIHCKVRLGDVFFTPNYYQNVAFANRINQKHIDFLFCEPNTMKPILGIELDDPTHRKSSRQERDKFVDEVFKTTGLPLLRVMAKQAYDSRELITQIGEVMAHTPHKQ